MDRRHIVSLAPVLAWTLLVTTLVFAGALPATEGLWVVLAVAFALGPSGWLGSSGWRRRAVELLIVPCALATTLVAEAGLRRMMVPVLVVGLALAAFEVAFQRASSPTVPILVAALALSVRCAVGLGLVSHGAMTISVALALPVILAGAAARAFGAEAGVVVALLAGVSGFERFHWPIVTAAFALSVLGFVVRRRDHGRTARACLPAAASVAWLAATMAPWNGVPITLALPGFGWLASGGVILAVAAAPVLPPAAAGALWFAVSFLGGPPQPAPPDVPASDISAGAPALHLPAGTGAPYVLDLSLASGASVRQGAPVGLLTVGSVRTTLRAGEDAAEWAHQRPDVVNTVAHRLPTTPVWRPVGLGGDAVWGVAGRRVLDVPVGVVPTLARAPELPPTVGLHVDAAGPSRPTPPRDWALPAWLGATALAVVALQILSGTWRRNAAWLPWSLLAVASFAARMNVEPLRLLAERHAPDLALAALVAAWLPAARRWLADRRVFVATGALLVPLAFATAHLTPPLGDESYHVLLLTSLRQDADFDLANNYDLSHTPANRIYVPFNHTFLQSPVLAVLLLPAFALLGRPGALAMLALAGAALVTLSVRAGERLGLRRSRQPLLVGLLIASYPLATFATQIWTELPGALLVVVSLLWAGAAAGRPVLASGAAVLGVAVKTRLGLVLAPLAAAAWLPGARSRRRLAVAAAAASVTAALGLTAAWLLIGHPLDPLGRRTLLDLLPRAPWPAARALAGLLFDASAGLVFAAPLLAACLAGLGSVWRRGKAAEHALFVGAVATVLPLLAVAEWRGGDAPPARYLVPLLPIAALAAAVVLEGRPRLRPAAALLIAPTLVVSWVFITRPSAAYCLGDGGWWLADALAVRFAADARHLFPSFLRPSPAAVTVPLAILAAAGFLWLLTRRHTAAVRGIARHAVAVWLVGGALLTAVLVWGHDSVVEIEDPQVQHNGGDLVPPAGSFSRFSVPNGWRLQPGDDVVVPLRVAPMARLRLAGWSDPPGARARLDVRWDDQAARTQVVPSWPVGLPAPAIGGLHRLHLTLGSDAAAAVVLDSLTVEHR